jgi:hypothetical protein
MESYWEDQQSTNCDSTDKEVKKPQRLVQTQDVKKKYEQKFYDWIEAKCEGTNGSCVPFCKVCTAKLSCSKTALSRHAEGKKTPGAT